MKEYFEILHKRKSVRKFSKNISISEKELSDITKHIEELNPLFSEIKIHIELVKTENNSSKGEYNILFYSEKQNGYLENAGYILEQMDLFLNTINIGVCWIGMAKSNHNIVDSLHYVIMMTIGKISSNDLRDNLSQFKRKKINDIWSGDSYKQIANTLRLAPSALNIQPWKVVSENSQIKLYRTSNFLSKISLGKISYFNSIDIGIALLFIEIALKKSEYQYDIKINPSYFDDSKNYFASLIIK